MSQAAAHKTIGRSAAPPAPVAAPVRSAGPARIQLAATLKVSSPSDPAEKEAESTAKKILRMPAPESTVARRFVSPYAARFSKVSASMARTTPEVSRKGEGQPDVSANIKAELASTQASGQPLPHGVRRFMEPRFNADFSRVRIHTGDKAAKLSTQLSAQAFTYGNQVYFGKDRYKPETEDGRELIAHELTHTIQQGGSVQRSEDVSVTHQSPVHVQRSLLSRGLDMVAERANDIPGFRMFTVVLGINPVNMSPVDRSAANILRAVIEFIPGGGLIRRALDNHGVIDKAANWIAQQMKTLGMAAGSIRDALVSFIEKLELGDILSPGATWNRAKRIFTEPIDRIIAFVSGLASGILELIKDAILRPLAGLAQGLAGYDLLKAVLEKDPVTGDPYPRNAETVIGGFMKLAKQDDVWATMQQAKAVPRAWKWFQNALTGLVGFVREVPALFIKALKSLEITDLILLPMAFVKVGRVFGDFVVRFVTWAGSAVWNLLEIIFDVVKPGALEYVKKTGAALKSILKNPLPFIGNLVKAAKLGFTNFADNFLEHLKAGLIDWLTGSLPGVYIPKAFSLSELLKFVFSVLGLTWANIRQKLVKAIGETAVKVLETGFDIVVTLVTQGPAAAWDKIKEQLTNLKDMVIGGITDLVIDAVVKKAIPKLIAMFIPGAGFISAIISIYDTVMVFVQKISKIIQVVTAFIDSIVAIAGGAIGAAAARVEKILAGLLSLAISFLAGFAGLGNVASKIMGVIEKIRAPIDKALDWLVNWIVTMAKKLGKFLVSKAKGLFNWAFVSATFKDSTGATHKIYVSESGVLTIASTPQAAEAFVNAYIKVKGDPKGVGPRVQPLIDEAKKLVVVIDKADKAKTKDDEIPAPDEQKKLLALSLQICELLSELVGKDRNVGKLIEKYLLEGQVGTYATVPKPVGDQLTPDHQPQASVIEAAAKFFKNRLKIKGGDLADRAANRAKKGFAINLHFNRHVAGATYGSKGWTRDGFYDHLVTKVTTPDEDKARAQVSQELQGLLSHDVGEMKKVVTKDLKDKAWKDLEVVTDATEREQLKKDIAGRIVSGQNQIASQPLDF